MVPSYYRKTASNYKNVTYSNEEWDMVSQGVDNIPIGCNQKNYLDRSTGNDYSSRENDSDLLVQILIRHKLLTVEQLKSVLKQQQIANKKLGEILLESELIPPEALAKALEEQYWRRNCYWVIG